MIEDGEETDLEDGDMDDEKQQGGGAHPQESYQQNEDRSNEVRTTTLKRNPSMGINAEAHVEPVTTGQMAAVEEVVARSIAMTRKIHRSSMMKKMTRVLC